MRSKYDTRTFYSEKLCTNRDSYTASPKNAWLHWHSLIGVPQMPSNKLNPMKQVKPVEMTPSRLSIQ